MVLKATGLSSRSQPKNWYIKICTVSQDIGQNVQKYAGLVWGPDFWHILLNISGPGAYFSKRIAALKPLVQAGRSEYHEPYKWNDLFLVLKGAADF